MNRMLRVLNAMILLGATLLVVMGVMLVGIPAGDALAQVPPTKEPAEPPTKEPPTAEPPTAEPPTQEPPTQEPPAATSAPTRRPTDEPDPPSPKPTAGQEQPRPPEEDRSEPNPNCQAVVEGDVIGDSSNRVTGATVMLKGEGVERTMMTDDNGHYGFGGLCAGTVTLVAYLPGGQPTASSALDVDGRSGYSLVLGTAAPAQDTAAETASPSVKAVATGEPSMPATGSSSHLLLGGAVLGALLLLLTGICWTIWVRERPRGQH